MRFGGFYALLGTGFVLTWLPWLLAGQFPDPVVLGLLIPAAPVYGSALIWIAVWRR